MTPSSTEKHGGGGGGGNGELRNKKIGDISQAQNAQIPIGYKPHEEREKKHTVYSIGINK